MKKAILIFALSLPGAYTFAQCNNTVTYFSGKAEFMDETGKVARSEEGKVVVRVTQSHITLMHNDDDNDTMEGTITGNVCDWKTPYKDGKTTFNTSFVERSGKSNNASVSIEGKEGKLVILIHFKGMGQTLKVMPDSYKEE